MTTPEHVPPSDVVLFTPEQWERRNAAAVSLDAQMAKMRADMRDLIVDCVRPPR